MKAFALCLVVFGMVLAQDPSLIVIEYDDYNGYGTAPLTAIANLWPS